MSEPSRDQPEVNRERSSPASAGVWLIGLSVATGLAAGIGLFTFRYASGLSYLSSDPKACINCHIMNRQYDGWTKASHHGVAGCVDCHLPHTFPEKYIAKAENGWHHSEAFTMQGFVEPIAMKPRAREILQANCVDCHRELTEHIAGGARGALDELTCIHCHANVGHGEHAGLGGPLREPELTNQAVERGER